MLIGLNLVAAAESGGGRSLLDYIAAGREIGIGIIVLSFVAVALVIASSLRIRKKRFVEDEFAATFEAAVSAKDLEKTEAICRDAASDIFVAGVLNAGFARSRVSPFGFLEMRSAMEDAARERVDRLYRSTEWIALIAAVAPMLGLLGTVVGILLAFDTISRTDGVPRPDELAGGISQALVTTVMGLLVAIPCSFALTYLRNRIDELADESIVVSERLAALASSEFGDEGGSKPARAERGARQ